jgi:hypothetical protein
LERLEKRPELEERFEMIMDIVENVSAEVEKADEAERRAIEAVRQLGNENKGRSSAKRKGDSYMDLSFTANKVLLSCPIRMRLLPHHQSMFTSGEQH